MMTHLNKCILQASKCPKCGNAEVLHTDSRQVAHYSLTSIECASCGFSTPIFWDDDAAVEYLLMINDLKKELNVL
jgi:predicted RNA-binding Zn-ribbon protein involved in translation (DUF1610 family)